MECGQCEVKVVRVPALMTAFEMRSARAYVDAFTQPTEELTRRIEEIEQSMQKMMDYMREKAQREVYHCINRLYEKSLNEANTCKRYVKLTTAYLGTLLYLTVHVKIFSELLYLTGTVEAFFGKGRGTNKGA
jgi:uncharacterized membrane protein